MRLSTRASVCGLVLPRSHPTQVEAIRASRAMPRRQTVISVDAHMSIAHCFLSALDLCLCTAMGATSSFAMITAILVVTSVARSCAEPVGQSTGAKQTRTRVLLVPRQGLLLVRRMRVLLVPLHVPKHVLADGSRCSRFSHGRWYCPRWPLDVMAGRPARCAPSRQATISHLVRVRAGHGNSCRMRIPTW